MIRLKTCNLILCKTFYTTTGAGARPDLEILNILISSTAQHNLVDRHQAGRTQPKTSWTSDLPLTVSLKFLFEDQAISNSIKLAK